MSEERLDEWMKVLREDYNRPRATPRDEMWKVIEAGLGARSPREADEAEVVSLEEARLRRTPSPHRVAGWAVAAAALAVLGIGIGRSSAPIAAPEVARPVSAEATRVATPNGSALRAAAIDHLGRTESLLTMVQADGRTGRLDPAIADWSVGLLSETRMFLDRPGAGDAAVRELLEDLELVLVQIVGASGMSGSARAQAEMSIALDCLEEREVLPRIQAAVPAGLGLAGT